ncbi:hypothetical protein [Alicyclobacillus sp. ALC3]|uniref:hypothetical protein n=1 Tax=Alicyclobacillus sp. ALC3 TaxID=2796143 RepID=UPI002379DADC|nr:hypothetical protein [Alicyclobacillus sp. ALC3]WDL99190.1 hypothetical protein JC200_11415 [Alicyclobacillus sp. ALC3]
MISQVVDVVVDELADSLVGDEFHIGLEAVKRFALFWLVVEREQARQDSDKISIYEYAKQARPKNKLADEFEEADWVRYYERTLDHFNSLNLEQKVRLRLRQQQEAAYRAAKSAQDKELKGNTGRYQGNSLFPYQKDEFSILDGIKDGGFDKAIETTYKRLVSEKGYLRKMNFKEYRAFVDVLADGIERSSEAHKNISYYKLEKRLGFQAMKSVLKALHESNEFGNGTQEAACSDLMLVLKLPLLSERQQYAEIYPGLSESEKVRWRIEVDGLLRFTGYCCQALAGLLSGGDEGHNRIALDEADWDAFSRLYTPNTFSNDYLLKRDFYASDFDTFMQALDKHNMLEFSTMTNPR